VYKYVHYSRRTRVARISRPAIRRHCAVRTASRDGQQQLSLLCTPVRLTAATAAGRVDRHALRVFSRRTGQTPTHPTHRRTTRYSPVVVALRQRHPHRARHPPQPEQHHRRVVGRFRYVCCVCVCLFLCEWMIHC